MSRLSVVPLQHMLCVLALVASGCRVYDAELIRELALGASADHFNHLADAGLVELADAAVDGGDSFEAKPFIVPGCGNGIVDARERCDIAIAQGQPGACPDGCNEHDGCFAQKLAGQRCGAHCVPMEITESISGDGCCPDGATPDSDSDCSPTCGNGVVEEGEVCDPPSSCPAKDSCFTQRACSIARFTGAAATCSARCQVLPATQCVSGDGCCPQGCSATRDADCEPGQPPQSGAGLAEAGTELPQAPSCPSGESCSDDQLGEACMMVHSGGRCQSCDCVYCAAEVASCERITADTGSCSRLVDCARENHCQGLDCLCGTAGWSACQNWPRGACIAQVQEVAGTRDFLSIVTTAVTPGSALEAALNLVQCRASHCAETCGL